MDTKLCGYCNHPAHAGIAPAEISKARAKELWDTRQRSWYGSMSELALTAGECETVKLCWARLSGNYSYMSTFWAIGKRGSSALLK